MNFEVVESKLDALKAQALERFDAWYLERKIRLANQQVRLAEESTAISLEAAARWRDYGRKLQDVRKQRGFTDKGNDWKPPVDWLTVGMLGLTCAVTALTVTLAMS